MTRTLIRYFGSHFTKNGYQTADGERERRGDAYTGKAIKDVYVVAGVEVIDCTLTVDLKRVWTR
jgi:hypothetical protein